MNTLRRDIYPNEIVIIDNRLFKCLSGNGMMYAIMGIIIDGVFIDTGVTCYVSGMDIDQAATIKWQSENGKYGEKK